MLVDLTQLRHGESGVVVEVKGGFGMSRRMQALGVRTGKRITKISSHFWRGPQTVKIDSFQVAIGFGMASRISVEVARDDEK